MMRAIPIPYTGKLFRRPCKQSGKGGITVKEVYEAPVLDVVVFDTEDVITNSGGVEV